MGSRWIHWKFSELSGLESLVALCFGIILFLIFLFWYSKPYEVPGGKKSAWLHAKQGPYSLCHASCQKIMALQSFLVKKYLLLLLFKFMFSIFCSILLAVFWLYYMDTLNASFSILELIQWYLKQISVIFRDFLQKLQG